MIIGNILSALPILFGIIWKKPVYMVFFLMLSEFFWFISFPSLLAALTRFKRKGLALGLYEDPTELAGLSEVLLWDTFMSLWESILYSIFLPH